MTVMSSTCSAMLAYQSDTHMPLCPYCFHLRRDAIRVLCAVPREVCAGLPIESGIGLPSSLVSSGLGSNRSTWLGSAFHEQEDDRLGHRLMVRFLGQQRIERRRRVPA